MDDVLQLAHEQIFLFVNGLHNDRITSVTSPERDAAQVKHLNSVSETETERKAGSQRVGTGVV
jgi:hypothetical protein